MASNEQANHRGRGDARRRRLDQALRANLHRRKASSDCVSGPQDRVAADPELEPPPRVVDGPAPT